MTRNQIEYWKLQESKRSNLTNEAETQRHNRVGESETNRHNVVSENETSRHNVASEGETFRHNTATEAYQANDLLEKSRSNRAQEAISQERNDIARAQLLESSRSNRAQEQIGRSNATSNLINAQSQKNYRQTSSGIAAVEARTRQQQLAETKRHNAAQESIDWAKTGATTATNVLGSLSSFFGRVIGRRSY